MNIQHRITKKPTSFLGIRCLILLIQGNIIGLEINPSLGSPFVKGDGYKILTNKALGFTPKLSMVFPKDRASALLQAKPMLVI